MRKINNAGLELLKSFEQCRLNAYQDSGGIWTVGWGHTGPEVVGGMTLNQLQADLIFEKDLEKFYHLDEYLSEQVNENQYSALVCLVFNIGLRALKLSQVMKKVNAGENPSKEWMGWNHVNGIPNIGLTRRRSAELELYNEIG